MAILLFAGGADGRYTYVNGYDYRPEHMKSGVAFQLQGIHTTLVHHYNDTLDFLILSTPTNTTIVQVSAEQQKHTNIKRDQLTIKYYYDTSYPQLQGFLHLKDRWSTV